MATNFEFIIVGGGAAGAVIASQLANTARAPSVLLVEAGSDPRASDPQLRAPADRTLWSLSNQKLLDHGHVSIPQKELLERRLPYRRGRALGGSTVTNYMAYLYGTMADYDAWAELVDDPVWRWEHVQEVFKSLETYLVELPAGMEAYVNPSRRDHGDSGPIKISFPRMWEKEGKKLLEAGTEIGVPICLDVNSGNPMGISLKVSTHDHAERTTSASAFLASPPANLHIWTDCPVSQLQLNGRRVVGVQCVDGRQATATKEVIICGGSIDSPKILLLSGIGPVGELSDLGIEVVQDLPGVGEGLQEHPGVPMMARMTGSFSDRWAFEKSPQKQREAAEQWTRDKTGPLSDGHSNMAFLFMKIPELQTTTEFQGLDDKTKQFLQQPCVPHYEMTAGGPNFFPDMDFGDDSYLAALAVGMNCQSRGKVSLASADPRDIPNLDFNFYDHPYDMRMMVEGMRKTLEFFNSKTLSPYLKGPVLMPESRSEEDIVVCSRYQPQGTES
ncbi:hypothetical protein AYO22_09806 [Fonsecaea multimorphosa]|nr:hypothetical protein AYO22_09806 [Fonsecaea multimorphosa]